MTAEARSPLVLSPEAFKLGRVRDTTDLAIRFASPRED
jgi:hypothetical protein